MKKTKESKKRSISPETTDKKLGFIHDRESWYYDVNYKNRRDSLEDAITIGTMHKERDGTVHLANAATIEFVRIDVLVPRLTMFDDTWKIFENERFMQFIKHLPKLSNKNMSASQFCEILKNEFNMVDITERANPRDGL